MSEHWLTEPYFDFEYKKYTLLAWGQEVEKAFKKWKLYPAMTRLRKHTKELERLQKTKQNLHAAFPKKLKALNLKKQKVEYHEVIFDDQVMQEIKAIVDYAFPIFSSYLEEGNRLLLSAQNELSLSPIGIIPLYQKEGYWMLRLNRRTLVFYYRLKRIVSKQSMPKDKISFTRLPGFDNAFLQTPENLKRELILRYPKIPNPATFYSECATFFPVKGTLLPVAKEQLYRYLAA